MKKVASFFAKIVRAVIGSKDTVARLLDLALSAIPTAYPFVQLVTTLTPSAWDDVALAAVKAAYPKFFDSTLTAEERKLYLLAVASELLKQKLPGLSTTVARIAVQIAFALQKVGATIG
jgi:hypothetical protein